MFWSGPPNKFAFSGLWPDKIPVILVDWIWSELTPVAGSEYITWIMNLTKGLVLDLTTFLKKTLLRLSPNYEQIWEGTSSRGPRGTYQNINLENFGGGPVQYFKKIPYILGTGFFNWSYLKRVQEIV